MNYIRLLKLLDKIAGPFALKFSVRRYKSSNSLKNILIIRPGGIGDAALLLPSIKKLKKEYPYLKIDIVCEPRNIGVFLGANYVNEIFNYLSAKDLLRLISKEYDLIIDTEQSHLLSTFFTNIIKANTRIGFSSNSRGKYYDVSVSYFHKEYEADSFKRLISAAIPGWKDNHFWNPPYIYASRMQKEKIEKILASIRRPISCIFAGASIPLRRWSSLRWARVIEGLWDMGFYPVVLGSENDRYINQQICNYSRSPLLDLTGRLNLAELAELFRRSELLVSTDSGILHIAVIEGLSTVSLFGPGIAEKWGPKGNKHIIIRKDLKCSPCTRFGDTPSCKKKALCMRLIDENDVISEIEKIVKRRDKK